MKCIVVYGTLSGSTMTAANLVSDTLKAAGQDVTFVTADPSVKDQVKSADAVVFASPSWEDQGKDGQPLPEVRQLIESLTKEDLANKKIAVCGLGDISYPHFCGAVDVIEGLLKDRGVTPAVPSLRIDRYYSSGDNEQKVKHWSSSLAKTIAS
jgi:flavodoxin I